MIQAFRRARPNIGLSDIRILLQGFTPDQIHSLARGSITAGVVAVSPPNDSADDDADNDADAGNDEGVERFAWDQAATKLTGVERLVVLLRQLSRYGSSSNQPKVEGWQRISITPDVELSIRAEFDTNQVSAFRELADLLRHVIQQPDAVVTDVDLS